MSLIVLSRQGVLQPFAHQPAEFQGQYQTVPATLARLSQAGFTLVVASNEPQLAGNEQQLDHLEHSHNRLRDQVENRGGTLAAFFYCPHSADQHCHCRKPKTGLLDAIELEFGVPAHDMVLISASAEDAVIAQDTGAHILLLGESSEHEQQRFNNLEQAAEYVLCHYSAQQNPL